MSDLIYREDAIEVVCELVPIRNDAVEIADAIRTIPSADLNSEFSEWARHWFKDSAERKGRNLLAEYPSLFECSECGTSCRNTIPWDCNINYCPNCGAKMEVARDEN